MPAHEEAAATSAKNLDAVVEKAGEITRKSDATIAAGNVERVTAQTALQTAQVRAGTGNTAAATEQRKTWQRQHAEQQKAAIEAQLKAAEEERKKNEQELERLAHETKLAPPAFRAGPHAAGAGGHGGHQQGHHTTSERAHAAAEQQEQLREREAAKATEQGEKAILQMIESSAKSGGDPTAVLKQLHTLQGSHNQAIADFATKMLTLVGGVISKLAATTAKVNSMQAELATIKLDHGGNG